MNPILKNKIENVLSEKLGYSAVIDKESALSGGSISFSSLIETDRKDRFFLKKNVSSSKGFFHSEAQGLKELKKADVLRIPEVLDYNDGESGIGSYILLEYLPTEAKSKRFFEEFGFGFASLHKVTQSKYGFNEDNYIGLTPQKNTWTNNWTGFFRTYRLEFQVNLAKASGLWDKNLDKLWNILNSKLDILIGSANEAAALLHGDLWSGNYLIGPSGKPCLIDPAVYYGSREADLAMTELFGGFDRRFYLAYQEAYPLEPDYKERIKIYQLYHLLNHLNLFGLAYKSSVLSILNYFCK